MIKDLLGITYVLLWHDDDNVLISFMRVVLKGCSHAIPNEVMTMTIQGVSLLWPELSYRF